jgi:hypothetical protein
LNARQFASTVRFLGGKLRCLSSVPKLVERYSLCIRGAETLHRNGSPPTRSCVNHLRSYRDDRKCILSQSAARCWKPATRGFGDRGGQDKARKVRAVGRGEEGRNFNHAPNIARYRAHLAVFSNAFSPFNFRHPMSLT